MISSHYTLVSNAINRDGESDAIGVKKNEDVRYLLYVTMNSAVWNIKVKFSI